MLCECRNIRFGGIWSGTPHRESARLARWLKGSRAVPEEQIMTLRRELAPRDAITAMREAELAEAAVVKAKLTAALLAERLLRGIPVTGQNFLFLGSDSGGDRAAILYTIIETERLNGSTPRRISPPCWTIWHVVMSTTTSRNCGTAALEFHASTAVAA